MKSLSSPVLDGEVCEVAPTDPMAGENGEDIDGLVLCSSISVSILVSGTCKLLRVGSTKGSTERGPGMPGLLKEIRKDHSKVREETCHCSPLVEQRYAD
jgi:hypothetical protein